ncbi:MAG: glycosyltransferase [Gemmatimonadetes bacterium]|nr:glycosyltransferase [Gemmatimonadota bacterium]
MVGLALVSLGILLYTWLGYPVGVWLLARTRRPPAPPAPGSPAVSVVLATRESEADITRRVANLRDTAYAGPLEVVVACDASRPGPLPQLNGARVVAGEPPRGKAGALNAGVSAATGEVLVFADTGQAFDRQTIPHLVDALRADPRRGAVSGALSIEGASRWNVASLYWRYERWLRTNEARLHSAVGVTGAVYAMPRAHWVPLPAGLILDDLFTPMQLATRGLRIGLEPSAVARDDRAFGQGTEYRRKTRTLTGVLQLCAWLPAVLHPGRNPIWVQFVSHKLLRLLTPYLVLAVVIGGIGGAYARWPDDTLRHVTAGVIYSCVALLLSGRLRAIAWGLLLMQVAVLRATWNAARGDWDVWRH